MWDVVYVIDQDTEEKVALNDEEEIAEWARAVEAKHSLRDIMAKHSLRDIMAAHAFELHNVNFHQWGTGHRYLCATRQE